MMEYKGYIGKVEFDNEAGIFHGEVTNTRDVITFQGKSVSELKKELKKSIDVYLAMCKKRGREPNKPFSGKFNVRVGTELHSRIYIAASRARQSLNEWITSTLKKAAR